MGSIQQDSEAQAQVERSVTILITGFGPFLDRFPVNPSFEIARLLPDHLPVDKQNSNAVRIILFPTPVRVAYDEVRQLVPRLLKAHEGAVDIVLHIGMASGRQHYALERYARREGYTRNKDVDGKMPSIDEGHTLFPDCPHVMTTSLDFEKVILNWEHNIANIAKGQPGAGADIRPSDDAGRYLCDYIYFNSLAYSARQSKSMEGTQASDRPILFFHVPPESDTVSLETGRAVAIALLQAMADTFVKQKKEKAAGTA